MAGNKVEEISQKVKQKINRQKLGRKISKGPIRGPRIGVSEGEKTRKILLIKS